MLSDICINSGAEVSFEKLNFHIYGSDDAVRAALMVISNIPFVKKSQYNMSVKIELANEHKEFVSGKKNGKINKIMSHSSVQIVFDGFNEYNFYIVVRGAQYEATKNGLDLVEQEMPASISFHVPDQYHKRIIGIGGQHIQRIMKKYSVFVKFSNAMDRGGFGKEEDDIKVDNVICRTPARNAQNLDLVKQEIMDMVEKADAEFVSETININRLYHRELIARLDKIDELEKKFNCKITFPSTEEASDIVTVSGPEYQVPFAVDEFLVSFAFCCLITCLLTIRRAWFQNPTISLSPPPPTSVNTFVLMSSKLKSLTSSSLSTRLTLSFRQRRLKPSMVKMSKSKPSTSCSPGTMLVG
jgi:hypothetical protein